MERAQPAGSVVAASISRQLSQTHADILAQSGRHDGWSADDATLARRTSRCSQWTVAQHLEHLAVVNAHILSFMDQAIAGATPSSGGPTLLGRIVLWTGHIPRGRAQAPEGTVPQSVPFPELRARLAGVRQSLAALAPRLDAVESARSRTPHPRLGQFTPAQWLRFIWIHNHHHDKIVLEILSGSGAARR